MPTPTATAVLVAAGNSTRMGPGERKPWRTLLGRPLVWHTLAAFDAAPSVSEVVLVGHHDDLERLERLRASEPVFAKVRSIVAGGAERTDSVRAGIAAASPAAQVLLVHDAARATIDADTIARAVAAAWEQDAAVVAVPVRDTLKRADAEGRAVDTLDREGLWAAQTPQAFRAERLRAALERAAREGWTPTDDAALFERYFGPVAIVPGDPANLKITTAADLVLAEAILARRGGTV